MSTGLKKKSVCWLCLKRFDPFTVNNIVPYEARLISATSNLGFDVSSSNTDPSKDGECYDIYTRFLHLSSRYLKLPITTEAFLRAAKDHKYFTGEDVKAFCGSCQDFVGCICDLYAELQAVKLRLIGRLEEVVGMMTGARKSVGDKLYRGLLKILMEQIGVNSMVRVERFQRVFQIICKAKSMDSGPKLLVPRLDLIPVPCQKVMMRIIVVFMLAAKHKPSKKTEIADNWNVSYPYQACRKLMMRLIVVFFLASKHIIVKREGKSVKDKHKSRAPEKLHCRRAGRPKKSVISRRNGHVTRKIKIKVIPPNQDIIENEQLEVDEDVVKTECDDGGEEGKAVEDNLTLTAGDNDGLNSIENDIDSDWSRGAASPMMSVASPGSDFQPANLNQNIDENQVEPPQKRWNLRDRKNRKPINFSESGSDNDPDYQQEEQEAAELKEEESASKIDKSKTTNPKNRRRPLKRNSKGWKKRPRECLNCSKIFYTVSELSEHKRQEHPRSQHENAGRPGKESKCTKCDLIFGTFTALRAHLKEVHPVVPEGETQCTRCHEIFPTGPEMVKHRRAVHYSCGRVKIKRRNGIHDEVDIKCSRCDLMFPTGHEMYLHRMKEHYKKDAKLRRKIDGLPTHGRKKETKCPECDEIFPSYRAYRDHRRNQHKQHDFNKIFNCNKCEEKFRTLKDLTTHRKSSHKISFTKHECHICYKTIISRERLEKHLEMHKNGTLKEVELWYCEVCGQHYYKKDGLQKHLTQAHKNLYTCYTCKADFGNGKLLRDHLITHEKPEKFFHCMICFRGFSSQQYFDIHVKVGHRNQRQSLCDYDMCNEIFDNVEELNEHLRKHADDAKEKGLTDWMEVYICGTCGKGFMRQYHFTLHQLTHTPHNVGRPGYDCPECGQNVRYLETLLTHYNRSHGLKLNVCKCHLCGSEFSSEVMYKIHRRTCHVEGQGQGQGEIINEQMFCNVCAEQFPNTKALADHKLEIHGHRRNGGPLINCPEPDCDFKGTLRQTNFHLNRAHDGKGGMLSCAKCDRKFVDIRHLNKHLYIHRVPKHMCDICGKMFKRPKDLKKHRARHAKNRQKPNMCTHCGMCFFTENGMKFHVWSKHTEGGELPHQCPFCGRGYGRKNLLTLHKKTCAKLQGGGGGDDKPVGEETRGPAKKRGRKRKNQEEEEEMSDKSTTEDEVEAEEKNVQVPVSQDPGEAPTTSTVDQLLSQNAPYPHQLPQRPPLLPVSAMSYQDWLNTTAAIGVLPSQLEYHQE